MMYGQKKKDNAETQSVLRLCEAGEETKEQTD